MHTYTNIISPFCILKGCQSKFLKNDVFLLLNIIFISANSAEPYKKATFHLELHCLPKSQLWKFLCVSMYLLVEVYCTVLGRVPNVLDILS